MNELQIFKNPEFGEIRTVKIDNKPYAVGNDVARALGYEKPRNAIARHCKGALKWGGVSLTTNQYGKTTEQKVTMNIIPEGDIIRLVVNSKLPAAEKYERWVFDEVLPSIHRQGKYSLTADKKPPVKSFTDSDATSMQLAIKALNAKIRLSNQYLKLANNSLLSKSEKAYLLTLAIETVTSERILLSAHEKNVKSSMKILGAFMDAQSEK